MITFPNLGNAGRLGNQLWQVAGAVGIGAAIGEQVSLPPDWSYRPYFSVPDELFTGQPGIDAGTLAGRLDARAQMYLQDFGLWADVQDTIREYFEPSAEATERVVDHVAALGGGPRLSLHVRRGDNVPGNDPGCTNKADYHPLRPTSYYRQALDAAGGYRSLIIFSDDIPWCRQTFADLDATYFEGVVRPKEHEPEYHTAPVLDWVDLFLMTHCDKHIISNSTYSWWGAYLAGDPSPIYPWPWFGPLLSYIDASLMFPPGWRALPS